ncbi:hypothetical protein CMUS01_14119 [Colletotrichum musicola]|uniref:Uncharacterized protein n=1 Tax=Colletotrichum musicola TaxID=2175873 RepID=A0A8H6MTE2_9PEZI|nr:hypothetical protein CMUS01_14119 [Colletotrichum musicola]
MAEPAEPAEYDSEDDSYATSPPPEGFDPEATSKFLDLFQTSDPDSILLDYWYVGLPACRTISHFETCSVEKSFGRDWRPNSWYDTCLKSVFYLRNKAVDTLFHVAARAGRLDVIDTAWRIFFLYSQWKPPKIESGSVAYVPLEEGEPEFHNDVDPLYPPKYMMAIVLLARKNAVGRTAANEAVAAGHEDVAEWLRLVLDRLTLGGRRATERRMARMEELVDGRYDIDGHHITPDQIPIVRRMWSSIARDGTITWGYC